MKNYRVSHDVAHLKADVIVCLFCLFLVSISKHLKETPQSHTVSNLSRDVRKPDFCICENKDADQLRGNREADQHLCFRYTDSTIPLLSKSEISNL